MAFGEVSAALGESGNISEVSQHDGSWREIISCKWADVKHPSEKLEQKRTSSTWVWLTNWVFSGRTDRWGAHVRIYRAEHLHYWKTRHVSLEVISPPRVSSHRPHHHPPCILTAGSQPHSRDWISNVGHIAAANGSSISTPRLSSSTHPILKSMQIHNKSQNAPSVPLTPSMSAGPLGNPVLGDCEAVKELPQGRWETLAHT